MAAKRRRLQVVLGGYISIKTCPQHGLKQLLAMGTYRIQLARATFRFRHFGAAFAHAKEKLVHSAQAFTG
jgi:hypothetical protein